MITIVAKSVVLEEKIEEFKKLAKILVEQSRKEEGNVSYTLYQDIENRNAFTFIEFWKNQEAVAIHNSSKHFTTLVPQMNQLRTEPSKVFSYEEVEFE